jgi:cysteine dioxygenase
MNIDYIINNFIVEKSINTYHNINLVKSYLYQPISIEQTQSYQKTLLFRNEQFEIYQINWLKNAETTIHQHPKNGCIMKIIQGSLHEKLYKAMTYHIEEKEMTNKYEIKNTIYNTNDVSYIDDTLGLHKIIAIENSISLHIYSPPKFYE